MASLPANRPVNGFAVDPGNTNVMYVAIPEGLFRSRDAGKSWESIGQGLKNLVAVALNPKRPVELYAISSDGVIFKSTDGGMRWEVLGRERRGDRPESGVYAEPLSQTSL